MDGYYEDEMMARKTSHGSIRPANALLHPVWLVALALLVFNDHFLKASELWPALSGKLSDFVGLLVAPVLLAVMFRVKTRRGLWLSAAAVGVVFSAINVSPALAATWDELVSLVMPYRTTVDPTDLVALAMLPLGLVMFGPVMRDRLDRSRARRTAQFALAVFGVVMCTATSEDLSCETDSDCNYDDDVCVDQWCEPLPDESMTTASSSGASMSMVDELETESLDDISLQQIETRPLESVDPVLLDYLRDDASPIAR